MTQSKYNFDNMTRLEMIDELTAVQNKKRTKLDNELNKLHREAVRLQKLLLDVEERQRTEKCLQDVIDECEILLRTETKHSYWWETWRRRKGCGYVLPFEVENAYATLKRYLDKRKK